MAVRMIAWKPNSTGYGIVELCQLSKLGRNEVSK
jgi:hypothetical protein